MLKLTALFLLLLFFSCSLFEIEDEGYSKEDDLQFLQDIIIQNNLTENSSKFDSDNGDGVFEPLELGNQKWVNDRLVSLDLSSTTPYNKDSSLYNIKVIPASIFKADKLEYLLVHHSDLSEICDEIVNHPSIKNLHFALNKITDLPEKIYKMKSLKILALQGNEIKSIPSTIASCENLETLLLFDNDITELPEKIWEIRNLKALNVSSNRLTKLPDNIDKIEEFEYLDFAQNYISELPKGFENITVKYGLSLNDNSLFCSGTEIDSSLVPAYLFSTQFNFEPYSRERQIYEMQHCGTP